MEVPVFDHRSVKQMFRESEGAVSYNGRPGHSGSQHVSITNAGLGQRFARSRNMIPLYTAFMTFDQAVRAAVLTLNSREAAPIIEAYFDHRAGRALELKAIDVGEWFPVRYARAHDTVATGQVTHMTFIAERNALRTCGLHIKTFFGTWPFD